MRTVIVFPGLVGVLFRKKKKHRDGRTWALLPGL
jgi:hypothetical protein